MTYTPSELKLLLVFLIVISDDELVFKNILFASFSVQYGRSQKVLDIMGWKYIIIIIIIHGYRIPN